MDIWKISHSNNFNEKWYGGIIDGVLLLFAIFLTIYSHWVWAIAVIFYSLTCIKLEVKKNENN